MKQKTVVVVAQWLPLLVLNPLIRIWKRLPANFFLLAKDANVYSPYPQTTDEFLLSNFPEYQYFCKSFWLRIKRIIVPFSNDNLSAYSVLALYKGKYRSFYLFF